MYITHNRIQGERYLNRTKEMFYIVKGTMFQEAITDMITYLPNDVVLKSTRKAVRIVRFNEFIQRCR